MIDAHVMWSIPAIAERDGVTKQAVSKTVKQLVGQHDLPVKRDGRGRVSAVSLAHYDHLRTRFFNPAKLPAAVEEPEIAKPLRDSDSFDEARRQAEWLKVDREKLRRQEELAQLVRKDLLAEALLMAGREIQSVIARLPNNADDLALLVSKDGAHGLRLGLRDIALKLSNEIADKMAAVLSDAPKIDALIDDGN